ncbi:hypothetical protein QO004_003304 [Rhizobium mesoamericanum]|uniref:hypothetical protein n=1 Tax=Rhizobium mesoamericanum TaxID=1079800 RepID=UPI00277E0C4F|nr:hypothetical protein [Rhizobium mesoamericanum]MDQ0561510.1 hypothetical protein [Rhizobium mesoamericanum]
MLRLSGICLVAVAAGLLSTSPTLAQDAISAPAQKTIGATKAKMVPSLAVLNSGGAKLENGKLTMSGISPTSIVFADRPVRSAGHVLTSEFIKQWDEGPDSFAKDPPNATISVLSVKGDSVADAVVVLKTPKLEGGNLTFEVAVLEGDLAGADGPASLFIDWFAARGPYGGVAVGGVGRAAVWRGGWYAHPGAYYGAGVVAGAALGAAVASERPYYYPHPACGYYPYPPCY